MDYSLIFVQDINQFYYLLYNYNFYNYINNYYKR